MSVLNEGTRRALFEAANAARARAYAPYSGYKVGAALLGADGAIYAGCNVENAAYPVTICAERTALVKAVSEGARDFEAVAVVTRDGGHPCGTCRQALNEFAPEMAVLVFSAAGDLVGECALSDLLPGAFGPANLKG
jgi:cytidine deaminase